MQFLKLNYGNYAHDIVSQSHAPARRDEGGWYAV
jgi:hypothetical protein